MQLEGGNPPLTGLEVEPGATPPPHRPAVSLTCLIRGRGSAAEPQRQVAAAREARNHHPGQEKPSVIDAPHRGEKFLYRGCPGLQIPHKAVSSVNDYAGGGPFLPRHP